MPSSATKPHAHALNVTLQTSLTAAKLSTPAVAAKIEKSLGITTVGELLRHYPRRYEDRSQFRPIAMLRDGEAVTICGTIVRADNLPTRRRMIITKIAVRDQSGVLLLTFFNQWFLKTQFDKLIGRQIVAFGKVSRIPASRNFEMTEVEWELVDSSKSGADDDSDDGAPVEARLATGRIVPVYPLSEGVKQERLRKMVWDALAVLPTDVPDDPYTAKFRREHELLSSAEALRQIHFPDNWGRLSEARERLAFDEYFALQLALAQRRIEARIDRGIVMSGGAAASAEIASQLPFSLTAAQERVIGEIGGDMAADVPMNRLLQGDVGSGKTVVAMAALLTAVRGGYQAALMAPTEILAEQHYQSIKKVMQVLDVPVLRLSGSSHTSREKLDALACVAAGQYKVVIGTHALIQQGVTFQRLGLAVIDEQHRFGVLQRAALRDKGLQSSGAVPDVLVMTATPIPRTLTLTAYGDLDVSVIDELPPGRKPIKTHWKRGDERPQVYDALRGLLKQRRQAYVICPLIEESEKMQARAATELARHLQEDVFTEFRVGLLHGQMKSGEKDAVMDAFRERATDLLVSTTVIEVGVDVPNASIIVIEDADRFGLAQLHQLRGRVGRGATQSYCLLIADARSADSAARMEVMERTTDGFVIAEEDLRLRGPGDFYGTRQSGVEMLPFMDVVSDIPILHNARDAAMSVLTDDPELSLPAHAPLRKIAAEARRKLSPAIGAN